MTIVEKIRNSDDLWIANLLRYIYERNIGINSTDRWDWVVWLRQELPEPKQSEDAKSITIGDLMNNVEIHHVEYTQEQLGYDK